MKKESFIVKKSNVFIFVIVIIMSTTISLAQLYQALLMRDIIDTAMLFDKNAVLNIFFIIVLTMLVEIIFGMIVSYMGSRFKSKFICGVRVKLVDHICRADFSQVQKYDTGNLLSIVTNDTEVIRKRIDSLFALGQIPIKVFLTLGVCLLISWKVTLFLLIFLPLFMVIGSIISNNLYKYNVKEKNESGQVNAYLLNMLSFIEVIKTYNLKDTFTKKNKNYLSNLLITKNKLLKHKFILNVFDAFVGYFPYIILLFVGGIFALKGELSLGDILSFSFLVGILGEGISILQNYISVKQEYKASLSRINDILNMPVENEINSHLDNMMDSGDIVYNFKNVDFKYDGKDSTLIDVSFEVKKGEKVAIFGNNGSGKSTILKLMSGLYLPTRGEIFFHGCDITKISVDKIRELIAVYSQYPLILPSSIKHNLTIVQDNINNDTYIEKAKNMQIYDVIMNLENGFDTEIEEDGFNFSRGQRQRIALARVINKSVNTYLLDEPTSALDINLEKQILEYFCQSSDTVIAVLHNEKYLDYFDRVIFLENGHVVSNKNVKKIGDK